MKVGNGLGGAGGFGRKGNDEDDDKKKGKVNNDKVNRHQDNDDGDPEKKSEKEGTGGRRNPLSGLGNRIRNEVRDLAQQAHARLGHGPGGGDIGNRLKEAGRQAWGAVKTGAVLVPGLVLMKVGSWLSKIGNNNENTGSRSGLSREDISGPQGPLQHLASGSSGGTDPANGDNSGDESPPPKPPRSFEYDRNHQPGPHGLEGADSPGSPGVASNPGGAAGGADGPSGSDSTNKILSKHPRVVTASQINHQEMTRVAQDVAGAIGSGSPSPYLLLPENNHGNHEQTQTVTGSNLIVHSNMTGPAEDMHRFLHNLGAWFESGDKRDLPDELKVLTPSDLRELEHSRGNMRSVLPIPAAVGGPYGSGVSVNFDPRLSFDSNGGFAAVTTGEPLIVALGSTVPHREELAAHYGNSSPLRRLMQSTQLPNAGSSDPIHVLSGGPRRGPLGGNDPLQIVQGHMEHLNQQQRDQLGQQMEHLFQAVRMLPLAGSGIRAEIYIPTPDDPPAAMPRVVLGGFDHITFESEVGHGPMTQHAYNQMRDGLLHGANVLKSLVQNFYPRQ